MVADTESADSLPGSSNAASETPAHGLASKYLFFCIPFYTTNFIAIISLPHGPQCAWPYLLLEPEVYNIEAFTTTSALS
jgi:hypothetical protein